MNRKRLIALLPLLLACAGAPLCAERVRLPEGTPVPVRLKADLATDHVEEGNRVDYVVARPVTINGVVIIPEGAAAWGAVQSVKSKSVHIDIEGVRLPNLTHVKLRTLREKQKRSGKDEIKVEVQGGGNLAAAAGSEFTGYVDDDVWVDVPPAAAAMKPASVAAPVPVAAPPQTATTATSAPASVATPTPAQSAEPATAAMVVRTPVPEPAVAVARSAPVDAAPAPAPAVASSAASVQEPEVSPAPTAAAPATPPTVAPAPSVPAAATATGDRITVECFSDPLGADILVDGDFYGNTPSILKLSPGSHRLEYQLAGHAIYTRQLSLMPGAGLSTIRATLEKK